jgi:hypothetical protein
LSTEEKKPFKALLLDEADVLVAVVELADEAGLTDRHVDLRPHGGECDCAPGQYRWDRQMKRLEPLPRFRRVPAEGVPSLEQVVHAFITGGKDAPAVKAWVAHYEQNGGKKPAKRRK